MGKHDGRQCIYDHKLERLMKQYGPDVYRMCYVILRDRTLAEDAGQDTFVKAYRKFDTLRKEDAASEKAWLMRIAINTCKDYRRASWFRLARQQVEMEELPDDMAYEMTLTHKVLSESLLKLPTKYKEVLLLFYYQDMTYEEIGEVLGVGRSTVHNRLVCAKRALKLEMEGRCSE